MRIILSFLLLFPSALLASTATIRSGEHVSFTRVVAALNEPSQYSVEQTDELIKVSIEGLETVQLGQAFERIDRARVARIEYEDGALIVTKACECTGHVYAVGESLVVVDIHDGDVDFEGQTALYTPAPAPASAPVVSPPEAQRLPVLFDPRLGPSDGTTAPRSNIDVPQSSLEIELPDTQAMPMPSNSVQDVMAEGIGQALSQGLLSFSPSGRRDARSETPRVALNLSPGAAGLQEGPMLGSGQVGAQNLKTSDSTALPDRGTGLRDLLPNSLMCEDQENFDLASWVSEDPFNEVIPKLRRILVEEFDVVDIAVAVELARKYVSFGFGAEALSVLDLAEATSPESSAVRQIASTLEYGAGSGDPMPAAYLECSGPVALWAAFSVPEIPRDVIFDEDEAILTLNAFPVNIRSVLAPELSKRLRAKGNASKAALVMRGLERSEGQLSPKGKLEAIEVSDTTKSEKDKGDGLTSVMSSAAEEAPLALIAFINRQVELGKEISAETALLAESYVMQFRGTKIEKELIAAQMIALAKSGQFDVAVALLRSSPLNGEGYNDSVAELFRTITKEADDVTFLKFSQLPIEDQNMAVEEGLRLQMAARASSLGFPNVSKRLLDTIVARRTSQEYERLFAEHLLHEQQYDRALAYLDSSLGEDERADLAEAFFEAGRYAEAAQTSLESGDGSLPLEAAFRSADVPIDGLEGADLVEALRRLQDTPPSTESGPGASGSLRSASDLLDNSETVLSDARALLSATRVQE